MNKHSTWSTKDNRETYALPRIKTDQRRDSLLEEEQEQTKKCDKTRESFASYPELLGSNGTSADRED